jgi:hypothetical protein
MLTNIEKVKVLPETILKLSYNFSFERTLKAKCDETISYSEEHSDKVLLESGNATSTVLHNFNSPPHTWPENKRFVEFLYANIPTILKEFQLMEQPISIVQSWVNKHSYGGETLEHTHQSVDLVVSSYLFCPPNSGNLLIRDPLEYHNWCSLRKPSPGEKYPYPWLEVPVKTNDVLIFPGWLVHKTEKSKSEIDRYVMTINLKYGMDPMMSPGMT